MQTALPGRFLWTMAGILAVTGSAPAQRIPDLGYVYPPGGRAGTTVEVRLGGFDWTPDMEFFVHDPRVRLSVTGLLGDILIPPPPYWFGAKSRIAALPLPREMPAKLVIPADVPSGSIHWQAANANGGTATGIFIVGTNPEILEDETRKSPQLLPSLPVTVSGRVAKIEEVDRYRFIAPKTGPVTCDLMARRLGSNFHGVLEVRDAAGQVLADVADTEGLDPALTFAAQAGAEYVVSVRDVDFGGDRSFVYRLSMIPGPRVVAAIPASGRRGETRSVEFVGFGLATGKPQLESIQRPVAFPANPALSSFPYQLETSWGTTPAFPLLVSDLAESVTLPRTSSNGQSLRLPAAVTGVLDQPGAEDRFVLEAKKGETWNITLEARRLGSPLDVALTLLGTDGKELATNDDLPGTTDAGLSFAVPSDGTYQLVVADRAGKSGSRAAVYRLVIQQPASDFSLQVMTQRINVLLGNKLDVVVKATRQGSFKGPIALSVAGLPTEVTVPGNLVIPADKSELAITFQAAKDVSSAAALTTITGSAQVGTQTIMRTALAPITSNLSPRGPEDNLVPSLLVASMMKPRFKGSPVDKDTGRKVNRGATFPAEVVLERLEGFQGEIILQMAARQSYQVQGITGPSVVVPPGVQKTIYPCFMPEWLETSRTSRMAMIGVAKVPDARGALRYLVAEMEGMVTMSIEGAILKVSHEATDLTLRPGQAFVVPMKIARSAKLAEPVKLELRLPPELGGLFQAEPMVVPPGQGEAVFRITAANNAPPRGVCLITIRGTALQDGKWPAISETRVPVELNAGERAQRGK